MWLLALWGCDANVGAPFGNSGTDDCIPVGAPCAGGEGPVNFAPDPQPEWWMYAHAAWDVEEEETPVQQAVPTPLLLQVTHHGYTSGVTMDAAAIAVVQGGTVVGGEPVDLEDPRLWSRMCDWPDTVASLQIRPDGLGEDILVDVDMVCDGLSEATVRVAVSLEDEPKVSWSTIREQFF